MKQAYQESRRIAFPACLALLITTISIYMPNKLLAQEAAAHPLHLIEQIATLPGVKGRLDHFTADPKRKRLLVAAVGNNTVHVLDAFGSTEVQRISGFEGPKSMVYISDLDKLVVISTTDAKVRFFDGKTYSLQKTIELPGDFEMVRYDPASKKVYVGWGDPKGNGGIAVIDPNTEERLNENYDTGGSPESFVVEANGSHIFANVPDAGNVVVAIDRKTGEVKKWAPIKGGAKNVAMALDEANHRLFTITRKTPVLAVFNTETGEEVAELPVAGDCADAFFDQKRNRIYAIGGWGYISVFQEKDPDHYELIENVPTQPGVRTGYFWAKRDLLYVAAQPNGDHPGEIWTYEPQ